jgi:hypothetical protein
MPKPTTKSRQELRSRFVRNAMPTEADFTDLIAASLNLADDGLLKLPDQPLSLVCPKPDQATVVRFYADPGADGSVWQMQLIGTAKTGLSLANQVGASVLFLDGETGNVGIGTQSPSGKLTITEATGTIASSQAGAAGSLVIDHENFNGGGSIVFRSKGNRGGDYAFMEYLDTNPSLSGTESGLLTIGIQNDADDHLALMPSGNVGINTLTPGYQLHVKGTAGVSGQVDLLTESNPIRFSRTYSGFVESAINAAEICNDTENQKLLMIAGNRSAGGVKRVGIWDDLFVAGKVGINALTSGYQLHVKGTAGVSGQVDLLTESNPIRFSGAYSGYPDSGVNNTEICNDTSTNKLLMIVGNKSAGDARKVGIWDDLQVARDLRVSRDLHIARDMHIAGLVVRKVWAARGGGENDKHTGGGREVKIVDKRSLNVCKIRADTALRITYYDNFSVCSAEGPGAARWEINVDGRSYITQNIYEPFIPITPTHCPRMMGGTIVGYAEGLSAGWHKITVSVHAVEVDNNTGRLYFQNTLHLTGHYGQTWALEAEEVQIS